MFVHVSPNLPERYENSVMYPKQKQKLIKEIYRFMREQIELRDDLLFLTARVGEKVHEKDLRDYLEKLAKKYNDYDNNNGFSYHIESTRFDYSAAVHVVVFRGQIYVKKFVFRFRKANIAAGLENISPTGLVEGYNFRVKFGEK
jgi:hypothetical protein